MVPTRPDAAWATAGLRHPTASASSKQYIGRTFIAPEGPPLNQVQTHAPSGTAWRKAGGAGGRLIVRGTTRRRIVSLLREAGAKEEYTPGVRSPFLNPCFYGTDIESKENLIACRPSGGGDNRRIIGADSLGHLPVEKLRALIGGSIPADACLTAAHPTPVPTDTGRNALKQKLSEKPGLDSCSLPVSARIG